MNATTATSLSTIHRGTRYTLRRSPASRMWEVSTHRLGYGGCHHIGGVKLFASLADLFKTCRAFDKIAEDVAGLLLMQSLRGNGETR